MRVRNLILTLTLGAALALALLWALTPTAPVRAERPAAPATPLIEHRDAISRALAYLKTQQAPDGGLVSPWTGQADDFTTIKTVIGLAAVNRPVAYLTSVSGTTPLDYLATRAYTYTRDASGTLFPGRAGMLLVAVVAGEGDPTAFGKYPDGHGSAGLPLNLVRDLLDTYHPETGAYSTTAQMGWSTGEANTVNQLWAILGLAAAQQPIPVTATNFLIGLQETDGGWGYGAGGDVDATALVVQALIASGNLPLDAAKVQEGLEFLRSRQAASGGWESWGALSADSTAAAIQAIAAAGYTPATASWAVAGHDPHTALVGLQAPDGSFSGNALGTAHALAGLAEAPLPILGNAQMVNRALTWMSETQNADGSWSGWAGPDPGATCDAVLAYAAAGYDPRTVHPSERVTSALDYLAATAAEFVQRSPDAAGKLALAVVASGGDPGNFGGVDIPAAITAWYSPTLGAFGVPTNTYHQAFAILGLASSNAPIPVTATQTLIALQQADGGWKYDLSPAAWNTTAPDHTGLALQALIAAQVTPTSTAIVSGLAFLRAQQDALGGWGNANSTAYALQGVLATRDSLDNWVSADGHSPFEALASYQKADGPFVWAWTLPTDNGLATWQAIPALLGRYYPLPPASLAPFRPVFRGPDPDRMVACQPQAAWGHSVEVVIPFGSDLDRNGSVALDWRVAGGRWVTGTAVHRADGAFTATIPVTQPLTYEFRAAFADPDGVQFGPTTAVTLKPHSVFLPVVLRG